MFGDPTFYWDGGGNKHSSQSLDWFPNNLIYLVESCSVSICLPE